MSGPAAQVALSTYMPHYTIVIYIVLECLVPSLCIKCEVVFEDYNVIIMYTNLYPTTFSCILQTSLVQIYYG